MGWAQGGVKVPNRNRVMKTNHVQNPNMKNKYVQIETAQQVRAILPLVTGRERDPVYLLGT